MTTSITDFLKISAAVVAVALALFFGYSVVGYATDTFTFASAAEPECSDCGGTDWGLSGWYWGGGVVGCSTELDGGGCGGGGGGGFTPYCTITVTPGTVVPHTYPAQYQYVVTWTAPGAASFSINNGIGSVTPPTSGTYTLTTAIIPGAFVGTASTHKGIVTCKAPPPPENPPYCSIIASPSTIAHGGSSVITWNTTKGTSFSINNGVGALTPVGGGTVTVRPTVTTTYTGTVIGLGGTAQCTTTVVVTPPAECKLEITKVANKTTIAVGEAVEYTVTVTNTGGATCTGSGVKIQDVLDSRLNYQSETHSSNLTGGYDGDPVYKLSDRTIRYNGWDLDPAETAWFKVVATGGTPTTCSETVPNKARVTSYEYNNFTTWVYSNIVHVTLTKDCTPPPTECELEISKVANKTTVAPNENVIYTIVVKNTGTKKCTGSGVKIEDTLDARFTYISETHTSNLDGGYGSDPVYKVSDRTLRYNGWDLDPNETGTMHVTVKAGTPTACSETIPNKARVTSYEYSNFTTWIYSNIVNVTVEKDCTPPPTECKLEITKVADKTTVAAGGTIEYTINVENSGTKKCTGSGVKIVDVLDARLNFQSETRSYNITPGYQTIPLYQSSNRTLSWNAWDLEPGETGWIKVVVTAATPTTCSEVVPNTAKITAFEYHNFMTWVESAVSNVTVTKNCYVPVPYCTMSIDPSSVSSGGPATLAWNSTNVTSVTIDQGVGSVALSGSKVVNPTVNTTYTGTFTGPGGTVTCQASVTIPSGPAPQCTLTASASKIKSGQSVIVSWTSQNVTSGTITTIGNASPVAGGSAEVFPADSTTFTGTFTGSYGTVTCSAPVTVEKGGGGCSGNCGGGLNQPNVVMLQKPPEAPLAFVTLDQMPYTGFEAGKALTLAFWISVGLLAAAITYFAMGQNALQMVLGAAPSPWKHNVYAELDEDVRDTTPHAVPNTLSEARRDSAAYSASVAAAPVYQYAAPVAAPVAQRPVVDGIPDLTDVIESRAHGAGVLMSPESVQLALELSKDRGEVLRQFGEILNEAVKVLPREDGWVMLTSERFADLAGTVTMPVTRATPTSTPSVEAILNSVMPPAAPTAQPVAQPNVEMPMTNSDDQSVVMSLARAILAGNRDQAFATLRNLEVSGAKAGTVMTVIAGAYDQLYRARRHGLTTELSGEALAVTDEALAQMTETFIHSMDQAYANPFTSLKLAIAQAFEVRG